MGLQLWGTQMHWGELLVKAATRGVLTLKSGVHQLCPGGWQFLAMSQVFSLANVDQVRMMFFRSTLCPQVQEMGISALMVWPPPIEAARQENFLGWSTPPKEGVYIM
jgi:hypothetical protein